MLAVLLVLGGIGADPIPAPVTAAPLRIDLPPAAQQWAEVPVPLGRVQLTAINGKPAQWVLVDDVGADLIESAGAAIFVSRQPGRYKVVIFQAESGFTRVVLVVGNPPPVPPPGPPTPPAPPAPPGPAPAPADPLTAAVRAAYQASTEADKDATRKDLIALFTILAKASADPKVATTAALLQKVADASDLMVGAGKLQAVRQVFAADLAKQFPEDVPADDATRKKAAGLFAKYAAALTL